MTDANQNSTPKSQSTSRSASGIGLAAIPLIAFSALVAIFYFGLYRGDPSTLPSTLIGKPAPGITLSALDGLLRDGTPVPGITDADLRAGGVTVVNVWASWCGPCRDEHPYLMQLAESDQVRLVGINHKDNPTNARRFLGFHGNPFDAVGTDASGRTAIDWGVYGVPETFIVNGQGIVVYKHVGPLTAEVLAQNLLPAIEQAHSGTLD
jgi:cytochrome c biogenesis protein CcmG/thiol:disulfide interchange protein DsbE